MNALTQIEVEGLEDVARQIAGDEFLSLEAEHEDLLCEIGWGEYTHAQLAQWKFESGYNLGEEGFYKANRDHFLELAREELAVMS